MPHPLRLQPRFQTYAWGDTTFIPQLFGLAEGDGRYAEAWLGAHPSLPSIVEADGGPAELDAAIAADATGLLGERVAGRHGGLPFLLKVLAAARPLSIQVHPSPEQARHGFEREQAAGIPLEAPHRCYKDRSHKPELIVALTPFHALCGFRAPDEIERTLETHPELRRLVPSWGATPEDARAAIDATFRLPAGEIAAALGELERRLRDEDARAPFSPGDPRHWFLACAREFGASDRGLLFVFLLHLIRLEPGQALYLPAGIVHAYLEGAGIEIMASSDNVLRCGLTPKHVDPVELLRVTDFSSARVPVLEPRARDGEHVYETDAEEFRLSRVDLDGARGFAATATGPEALLVLGEGAVTLRASDGRTLELPRGGACFVPDGVRYALRAAAPATVYRAAVPATGAPRFRGREPARLAFGTSGLRGLVTDITDLEAYVNTRGFMSYLLETRVAAPGTPVAIAGDLRPSTERILVAVARAIADAGFSIVYAGRIPTPALTFHALEEGWPSVMVTGSHIPFDRNGIKFNKPTGEVLKDDEAPILAAVERARREVYGQPAGTSPFDDAGMLRAGHAPALPAEDGAARARYVRRYLEFFPPGALAGCTLGLYEHSAVGREVLAEILRGLGARVFPVGRSAGFVAIDTEAISETKLDELRAIGDELRARVGPIDALVSTDGDSDRPMLLVPDAAGRLRFCGGDVLGLLVAETLAPDSVAVPVTSTDAIELRLASREGRRAVEIARTRIGSPWVIAAMARQSGRRRVGWEANGGFLVGSDLERDGRVLRALPTRDAVLPLVAALHAAALARAPVVSLLEGLPRRHGTAGLLDAVPPETSRALVERLSPPAPAPSEVSYPSGDARLEAIRAELARCFSPALGFGGIQKINFVDGIRVFFDNGDIAHVRPSGNAPQLRIYAVADTEERAGAIVAMGLAEPDGILRRLTRDAQGVGDSPTLSCAAIVGG